MLALVLGVADYLRRDVSWPDVAEPAPNPPVLEAGVGRGCSPVSCGIF